MKRPDTLHRQVKQSRPEVLLAAVAVALVAAALACSPSGLTFRPTPSPSGVQPPVLTPAETADQGVDRVKLTPTPQVNPSYDGGDGLRTARLEPIDLGQIAHGEIEGLQQADNWLIEGRAGQAIAVQVIGKDDCDPRARLIDPQGVVIAEDDDGGGRTSALITASLPVTGTYTVRVDGFVAGQYTILVQDMYAGGRSYGLVAYGGAVQGSIAGEGSSQSWNFFGAAGDEVTLYAQAGSAGLDPVLQLLDAGGNEIAYDDDSGGNYNPYLLVELPEDGLYTILISAYSGSGSYTLSVDLTPPPTPMSYGDRVTGDLASSDVLVRYTFSAETGDLVTIAMNAASVDLDPTLRLLDSQGREVAYDDDSGGDLNALIFFPVPEGGDYTVVAGRLSGSGSYELRLDLAPEPALIAYGDQIESSLSSNVPVSLWAFEGQAGDFVSIAMEAVGAGLDPKLTLFGPQGEEVAYNDDSGNGLNSAIYTMLTENGRYILLGAARSGSGDYILRFDQIAPTPVQYGGTVAGAISSSAPFGLWSFEGRAGDTVRIALIVTEGDLDPTLVLFGPSGEQLIYDDSGGDWNPLIDSFVLPEDGTYTILCHSYSGVGSFRLTLERRQQ